MTLWHHLGLMGLEKLAASSSLLSRIKKKATIRDRVTKFVSKPSTKVGLGLALGGTGALALFGPMVARSLLNRNRRRRR